ncbi:MAG TPA: DUF3501 family protein [Blastocatellia bacterium]|nr:DUF3501 family protein [Blastocatellia bacterium]
MTKIQIFDVKNILEYEKERDAFRDRIIALKKRRRVAVGDVVTFLFESRDTVLFQIQEMVRAERIVDPAKIQEEIDVYAELLPDRRTLAVTMFIEIEDQSNIKRDLERFLGITAIGIVYIQIGDDLRVNADFEGGREEEEAGKVAAVQYGRFHFGEAEHQAFTAGKLPVKLVIAHPNYQNQTVLPAETLSELRKDMV